MREELRDKFKVHRSRLVNELDASTSFLASLLSKGVINEEHKALIQSKAMRPEKVDTLVDILYTREDRMFELFCGVLKSENLDLFDLLNEHQDISEGCSAATPLHSQIDRKRDGIDNESGPPQKKSKQSGSSSVANNQPSTSMCVEDSSVHCPSPSKKPCNTEQNIGFGNDIDNVPSSDISEMVDAVQPVPIEPGKSRIFQNYENIDLKNCSPSDIIQGFKKVMIKCGEELEDYIDPENGLLTALGNRSIINDADIDHLVKLKPYQELNAQLLGKIEISIHSTSKLFIEALCKDEQDHIAKFIVTAECETDSDERLLPREWRRVIDDNMFCLEQLIDTEKRDLLHQLVRAKCITSRHRDRVIRSEPEVKAYELLIIIQRRRYRDFRKFMEFQKKTIVNILEKGGVTEIKIQFQEEQGDNRKLVAELLIKKLRGYVDEDIANDPGEDQTKTVITFLAELAEYGVCFIGICHETSTSNSDLSMFFQGHREDPYPVLNSGCESGTLQNKLEELFRSLLKIPDCWPPLVKEATMGKHSNKHHMTIHNDHGSVDGCGAVFHLTTTCDGCSIHPLPGIRYKCQACPDFDLCAACKHKGIHSHHQFLVIDTPQELLTALPQGFKPDIVLHTDTVCDGCGLKPVPGVRYKCKYCSDYDLCSVCKHSGIHGHHQFYALDKTGFFSYSQDSCNLDVPLHTTTTCDECGTHPLPGTRFKCQTCWDYDLCSVCRFKGIHEHHQFLTIEKPAQANLKVVLHTTTTCDECRVNPLPGIRYKCKTCPDYDLCFTCKGKGIHSHHLFTAIDKPQSFSLLFVQQLNREKWKRSTPGVAFNREILDADDPEVEFVVNNIRSTGGSDWIARITDISRVENYKQYSVYASCKEEMERENGSNFTNERILWHGTSKNVLNNIYRDGFNRSYCGKNATAYGDGVYFANDFRYSARTTYSPPDSNGFKYIFQCRVLTGHYTTGMTGLKEPPMRNQDLRYDSVVDDIQSPNMFVIFKDMQAYPEYVITLKNS